MTPPGITSEILESASADRAPLSPQLSKESQTSTASSGASRKKRRRSDKCFIFLFWYAIDRYFIHIVQFSAGEHNF